MSKKTPLVVTVNAKEYLSLIDKAVCFDRMNRKTFCVGGRIITQDSACPHCESRDPTGVCYGKTYEQLAEPKYHVHVYPKKGKTVTRFHVVYSELEKWKETLFSTLQRNDFKKIEIIPQYPYDNPY